MLYIKITNNNNLIQINWLTGSDIKIHDPTQNSTG